MKAMMVILFLIVSGCTYMTERNGQPFCNQINVFGATAPDCPVTNESETT